MGIFVQNEKQINFQNEGQIKGKRGLIKGVMRFDFPETSGGKLIVKGKIVDVRREKKLKLKKIFPCLKDFKRRLIECF